MFHYQRLRKSKGVGSVKRYNLTFTIVRINRESTRGRKRKLAIFMVMGILQGSNFILPVLVMPFVIKKIGADGYGVVAVAQVVMLIFCTVTDYGCNLTATRALALQRDKVSENARLFFTVLAAKMVICIVL